MARVLYDDKTLVAKVKTLFREQGITIASVLAEFTLLITTIISSIVAGAKGVTAIAAGTAAGSGSVKPSTPANPKTATGVVKRQLENLANLFKKIGVKLLAALPGMLGTIASFIFNMLSKTAGFLADHVWAMISGVAVLMFVYVNKRI